MKKKTLCSLLALILVLTMLAGCGSKEKTPQAEPAGAEPAQASVEPEEPEATPAPAAAAADDNPIIGFANYSTISYFMDMGAAAHKTADEAGCEFHELYHGGDASVMVEQVEDLIAMGCKILITEETDDTSMVKTFQELKEKGIIIVSCDIRTKEGVDYWIASDNKQIGRTSGENAVAYLTEKYGEAKGTIAILSSKTTTSMIDRAEGFKEVIAEYPGIEIVDEQFPTDFSAVNMMTLTDDILQVYGKDTLDVIFASNQTQVEGANSAIVTAKRQDVALFGVDDSDAIYEALKDPNSTLQSTVVQDPIAMGVQAVTAGLALYRGETFESDTYNPDVVLVTRDNVADYMSEKAAQVEALKDYYN